MFATSLLLIVMLVPASETAGPKGRIYNVNPLIDAGAGIAMFGVAALIDFEKDFWSGLSPCTGEGRRPSEEERRAFEALSDEGGVCGVDSIGVFERFATRQGSSLARLLSDVLLLTLAAAPYGYSLGDVFASHVNDPGFRFGEESLIAIQAQAATLLATNILKMVVKRPRPLTHNTRLSKAERFQGDARLSFPSGHAAFAFASASLIAFTAQARHGNSPATWISGSVAYLFASSVAYLRVRGGKHFLSDVVAGALLGIAAGLIIPTLHALNDPVPSDLEDQESPLMISIGGSF